MEFRQAEAIELCKFYFKELQLVITCKKARQTALWTIKGDSDCKTTEGITEKGPKNKKQNSQEWYNFYMRKDKMKVSREEY